MSRQLIIDAYFDFICPWCLIGKRHLVAALNQLRNEDPQLIVKVNWHGVQLLPGVPSRGLPFDEFYLNRLGSEQAVRERQRQVQQAAAAAGVLIDLSAIKRMPNTASAHSLFRLAAQLGDVSRLNALLERMFAAYFCNGEDLGTRETLLKIAEECGYFPQDLASAIPGEEHPFSTKPGRRAPDAVPYFVINNSQGVSGAQTADVLAETCRRVLSSPIAGDSCNG